MWHAKSSSMPHHSTDDLPIAQLRSSLDVVPCLPRLLYGLLHAPDRNDMAWKKDNTERERGRRWVEGRE